jgi:hypothetical protein
LLARDPLELHWIGCAVGGSHERSVDAALAAASLFSAPRQAGVFGRTERLDVFRAAFVNGVSTDFLSFSDTHPVTLIHPTGVLGPAQPRYFGDQFCVGIAKIESDTGFLAIRCLHL